MKLLVVILYTLAMASACQDSQNSLNSRNYSFQQQVARNFRASVWKGQKNFQRQAAPAREYLTNFCSGAKICTFQSRNGVNYVVDAVEAEKPVAMGVNTPVASLMGNQMGINISTDHADNGEFKVFLQEPHSKARVDIGITVSKLTTEIGEGKLPEIDKIVAECTVGGCVGLRLVFDPSLDEGAGFKATTIVIAENSVYTSEVADIKYSDVVEKILPGKCDG